MRRQKEVQAQPTQLLCSHTSPTHDDRTLCRKNMAREREIEKGRVRGREKGGSKGERGMEGDRRRGREKRREGGRENEGWRQRDGGREKERERRPSEVLEYCPFL